MCMWGRVCSVCMGAQRGQKRVSGPRELELQDIELSPAPMWVLGTGLRSS